VRAPAIALSLLILAVALPVEATTPQLTPTLFLTRINVNKTGWDPFSTGDMIAIHEVFLRGAQRQQVSYLSYATHYSQRVAGIRPSTSGRIAWTMNLRADGREPQNWPRTRHEASTGGGPVRVLPHPPWSRYREAWLTVLEHATEVSTWTLDDIDEWSVCDGQVHDWGSPRLDRARAERLGLVEVECGDTQNDFWARPSLLPNEETVIDRD
jgi:hypothetical protein